MFTKGNALSAVLSFSAGRTPLVGKRETCPICRDGASHAELAECAYI